MGDTKPDKVQHDNLLEVAIETKLRDTNDNSIAEFMDQYGVTGTDSSGRNIAHVLAAGGQLEALKILVEKYPDTLSTENNNNQTALEEAIKNNHEKCAIVCINAMDHKSLKKQNQQGNNVAHALVENDRHEALQALVENYPSVLDRPDNNGFLPAHLAAINNSSKCLSFLLEKTGVEQVMRTVRDIPHLNAALLAAEKNSAKAMDVLLNAYSAKGVASTEFLDVFDDHNISSLDTPTATTTKVKCDYVKLVHYFTTKQATQTEKNHFNNLLAKIFVTIDPDQPFTSIDTLTGEVKPDAIQAEILDFVKSAESQKSSMSGFFSSPEISGKYTQLLKNLASNDKHQVGLVFKNFFQPYLDTHIIGKSEEKTYQPPTPVFKNPD